MRHPKIRPRTLFLPLAAACLCVASILSGPLYAAAASFAAKQTPPENTCVSIADAARQPNKDLCVAAHVYDVVELTDGSRFLDVCPPATADADCTFTIVSHPADRADVGDLRRLRDQNVQIRGIVRATHGRMGIVLSHIRQFSGGPEKFRPNPKLLRGFSSQSDRMPVRDPNLSSSGNHRAFMNNRDTESLPLRK